VVNADDKSAQYFADATTATVYRFSTKDAENCELKLTSLESKAEGNKYGVITGQGESFTVGDKLPGAFNAGNVLASLIVVKHLLDAGSEKPSYEDLAALVPKLKAVNGRMTHVDCGQNFEVLIDYAHTPSSFETIFPPLRERQDKKKKRIITLFGSAGERDTEKRSPQGAIASRYSDVIIITDEDPRGESPMAICEEIAEGCLKEKPGLKVWKAADQSSWNGAPLDADLYLIPNRPEAIREAVGMARDGDLVLLLGKGHENSIIYADHTDKYDELAEAKKALFELLNSD
jgi:UDP-N-acetylmuramoyl-L-alanyl-D-glutamate--2,6-diaminopimelate ligase